MREDGRQQVCIVGLQEYCVSDIEQVKEYIDKGNLSRSTGSTGANEESSRSHAILQLVVKKAQEGKEGIGKISFIVVGKISFIDLAGSERGADTTDNDRQTRLNNIIFLYRVNYFIILKNFLLSYNKIITFIYNKNEIVTKMFNYFY